MVLFLGNMFSGFGTLFYGTLPLPYLASIHSLTNPPPYIVSILCLNAICILSEDRFLARVGWTRSRQSDVGFGVQSDPNGFKARIIDGISGIRTATRIPLILVNILVILYLLILG